MAGLRQDRIGIVKRKSSMKEIYRSAGIQVARGAVVRTLEEAGRRTARAFDVRGRFFHFEFFRADRDGGIVALEVNLRPPGGLTTDMFNYANDIDIYREWARVVAHNRFTAAWSRPYTMSATSPGTSRKPRNAARRGPAMNRVTSLSAPFSP